LRRATSLDYDLPNMEASRTQGASFLDKVTLSEANVVQRNDIGLRIPLVSPGRIRPWMGIPAELFSDGGRLHEAFKRQLYVQVSKRTVG